MVALERLLALVALTAVLMAGCTGPFEGDEDAAAGTDPSQSPLPSGGGDTPGSLDPTLGQVRMTNCTMMYAAGVTSDEKASAYLPPDFTTPSTAPGTATAFVELRHCPQVVLANGTEVRPYQEAVAGIVVDAPASYETPEGTFELWMLGYWAMDPNVKGQLRAMGVPVSEGRAELSLTSPPSLEEEVAPIWGALSEADGEAWRIDSYAEDDRLQQSLAFRWFWQDDESVRSMNRTDTSWMALRNAVGRATISEGSVFGDVYESGENLPISILMYWELDGALRP